MIQKIIKLLNSTYNKHSRKLLKKYENQYITKIEIGKSPIPSYIIDYANIFSLGQVSKNLSNEIFHFFLKITLKTCSIIIEKNEIIIIKKWKYRPNTSYTEVNIIKPITLKKLVHRTRKQMGPLFFTYDVKDNNCEHFVIELLKVMNIEKPSVLHNDFDHMYDNIVLTKMAWDFTIYIRKILLILYYSYCSNE